MSGNIIIVVLGAPTNAEGQPGPDLKQRLDRCLQMIQHQEDEEYMGVVVTGGNPQTYGSTGTVREGHCMRNYLIANGYNTKQKIIVEDKAPSTFHNALYVKSLLRQRGELPTEPSSPFLTLIIITTDWHIERTLLCFKTIFCDVTNIALKLESVPSDATDTVVKERIVMEKHLMKDWVPLCIENEQNHPDMPSVTDASIACQEEQSKWIEVACPDGKSVFLNGITKVKNTPTNIF